LEEKSPCLGNDPDFVLHCYDIVALEREADLQRLYSVAVFLMNYEMPVGLDITLIILENWQVRQQEWC